MASIELARGYAANKLKVVVESKKRPARIAEYSARTILPPGCVGCSSRRKLLISEFTLDRDQARIIEKAQTVAKEMGIGVEIIDVGRQSGVHRLLRVLTGRVSAPSVLIPERAVRSSNMFPVLRKINAMKNSLEESLDLLHDHICPISVIQL